MDVTKRASMDVIKRARQGGAGGDDQGAAVPVEASTTALDLFIFTSMA
jgi:hypothetical protein